MAKEYQLLTSSPATAFDESILRILRELSETGYTPKSMCGVIQTEEGEVLTFYHNASMQDMILAKGQLELDIINDNILGNLEYYVDQAAKDGLIAFLDEDEDEEDMED